MKKKVLILAAMLSVLLFSFGTAHAFLGINDDYLGTDVVIPMVCEVSPGLNTLWAIGNTDGDVAADVLVFDRNSKLIYDDFVEWTPLDVVADDCMSLIAQMSPAQQAALVRTIKAGTVNKSYYLGYVVYFNFFADFDVLAPWVYLVDLNKGYAAGFNGYAVEFGLDLSIDPVDFIDDGNLCEDGCCIWADFLFPRYYIHNDKTETFNWWIVLKGSNTDVTLDGVICNEEEDCRSLGILLPDELTVINVVEFIPSAIHTGFPKAGFGWFALAPLLDETTLAWSYQRAQADTSTLSWSVVHPVHRAGDLSCGP